MNPLRNSAAVLVLAALAACGQDEPAPAPTAPVDMSPAAPTTAAAEAPVVEEPAIEAPVQAPPAPPPVVAAPAPVTVYQCADGQTVAARYPDADTAVIDYRGRTRTLTIARSASGARYVGEGLQWWTKGRRDGALSRLRPGETIASGEATACRVGGPPPLNPPAPGQPGGLPDDRTPVSEAPFTPQSAQGAADVVQTYFALIEAGKFNEARALWGRGPGDRTDYASYGEYHANVGAPGEIEGAAGSLYVTVPVQVYGRERDGAEFNRRGEVTLRRVNDVPGSTAAQRRWHIERIELR